MVKKQALKHPKKKGPEYKMSLSASMGPGDFDFAAKTGRSFTINSDIHS